jgi:hypothetical protein
MPAQVLKQDSWLKQEFPEPTRGELIGASAAELPRGRVEPTQRGALARALGVFCVVFGLRRRAPE